MSGTGLGGLSMEELRARRAAARRAAEIAHLRARQGGGADAAALAGLDATVTALTDELISRYADNLSLVESLLAPAYPAKVSMHPGDQR